MVTGRPRVLRCFSWERAPWSWSCGRRGHAGQWHTPQRLPDGEGETRSRQSGESQRRGPATRWAAAPAAGVAPGEMETGTLEGRLAALPARPTLRACRRPCVRDFVWGAGAGRGLPQRSGGDQEGCGPPLHFPTLKPVSGLRVSPASSSLRLLLRPLSPIPASQASRPWSPFPRALWGLCHDSLWGRLVPSQHQVAGETRSMEVPRCRLLRVVGRPGEGETWLRPHVPRLGFQLPTGFLLLNPAASGLGL